jgi:hypothetical protein
MKGSVKMSNQDEKNLDLLSMFHYILGGITALFGCFPLLHLGAGIAMLAGVFDGPEVPPLFVGWFFVLFAGAFILFYWSMAILIIISGRRLKQRRSHTFCLVIAGIMCMNMPLGTVLGVFTIITLVKDSVKELFDVSSGSMLSAGRK